MDYTGLVPQIAAALHMAPSSLLMLIGVVYVAARATSRLIPDTATGWQATVRNVAGVISVDISSRIAPGISIAEIARAAAQTPPIPEKIIGEKGAEAESGILELAASEIISPAPAIPTEPLTPAPDAPASDAILVASAATDPTPEAPAIPKENTMSLKSFFSHLIGGFLMTETQKLVSKTMEKYPAVVADIQKLIADATASTDPVATKLFNVADDSVKLLPDVLQALPSVKSFAILLVQTIYADGISELETEASAAIGKL